MHKNVKLGYIGLISVSLAILAGGLVGVIPHPIGRAILGTIVLLGVAGFLSTTLVLIRESPPTIDVKTMK